MVCLILWLVCTKIENRINSVAQMGRNLKRARVRAGRQVKRYCREQSSAWGEALQACGMMIVTYRLYKQWQKENHRRY